MINILVVMALGVCLAGAASAQVAQVGANPGQGGLPAVPTTRIIAIGHLTPHADAGALRRTLPDEVRDTVALYLEGKVDQWYSRKDEAGVVFVLNYQDVATAREALERLPLGKAGLMSFDFIPVGPLAPLGLKSAAPAASAAR